MITPPPEGTRMITSREGPVSAETRGAEVQNAGAIGTSERVPSGGGAAGEGKPLVLPSELTGKFPFDAVADHFYEAVDEDELSFDDGDVVTVLSRASDAGWVIATLAGRKGLAPLTHLVLPKSGASAGAPPSTFTSAASPMGGLPPENGFEAQGGLEAAFSAHGRAEAPAQSVADMMAPAGGGTKGRAMAHQASTDKTLDEMTSVVDRMLRDAGLGDKFKEEDEAARMRWDAVRSKRTHTKCACVCARSCLAPCHTSM